MLISTASSIEHQVPFQVFLDMMRDMSSGGRGRFADMVQADRPASPADLPVTNIYIHDTGEFKVNEVFNSGYG